MWRLDGSGAAWLDELSLREADDGAELLWEAAIREPIRGFYNPTDCFLLDQLVEAAERKGIYLQLCLVTRDLYMSSLKDDQSSEYAQAIRDAKNLLRYAVARWGYSTHVAAWEYFNEIDPHLPTDRFYDELGAYLEQIDVYRHLRTTSTWSPSPKDWKHPRLDIAETHHYIRPADKEQGHDEVAVVLQRVGLLRQHAPRRPALLGEFGLAEDNWQRSPYMKQDANLVHFHNALWSSALSGASGTALFWWWELLDPMDAYPHYAPLSKFMADVPLDSGLEATSARAAGGERPRHRPAGPRLRLPVALQPAGHMVEPSRREEDARHDRFRPLGSASACSGNLPRRVVGHRPWRRRARGPG